MPPSTKPELCAYSLQLAIGSMHFGYNAPRGYYILSISVRGHEKIKYIALSSSKSFLRAGQKKDDILKYKVRSVPMSVEQSFYRSEPFYIHQGGQTIHFNTIITFTVGAKNLQTVTAGLTFRLYYCEFPKALGDPATADEKNFGILYEQSPIDLEKNDPYAKRRCFIDNFCVPYVSYHNESFGMSDNFSLCLVVANLLSTVSATLDEVNACVSISDGSDFAQSEMLMSDDCGESVELLDQQKVKRYKPLTKSRIDMAEVVQSYNNLHTLLYDVCGCTLPCPTDFRADSTAITPTNVDFLFEATKHISIRTSRDKWRLFVNRFECESLDTVFKVPDAYNESYYQESAYEQRKLIEAYFRPKFMLDSQPTASSSSRPASACNPSRRVSCGRPASARVGYNIMYGNIPHKSNIVVSSVESAKGEIIRAILRNRRSCPYLRPESYVTENPVVHVRQYMATSGGNHEDDESSAVDYGEELVLSVVAKNTPLRESDLRLSSGPASRSVPVLEKATTSKKVDLYVFVHGLQAEYFDMLNICEALLQHRSGRAIKILCKSHTATSGGRILDNCLLVYREIYDRVAEAKLTFDDIGSINLVGHSLGGLIATRVAAMFNAELKTKLGMLITINAPLTGTAFKSSLVNMVVPFLAAKTPAIKEMKSCGADGIVYDTANQFPPFERVYLIGTCGDGFVPFRCATGIGVTAEQHLVSGFIRRRIKARVVKQAIVCFEARDLKVGGGRLSNLIGQTAHLRLLEDKDAIRLVFGALDV